MRSKNLELFITFSKIGAFTFGGGYAMIPLIQSEAVDARHWISEQDLLDVVAIAESTPGPIAINAATFVGYKVAGFRGALAATLGVSLPSFVIITLIAILFSNFGDNKYVQDAFWGIRIAVVALIIKALVSLFKKCPKTAISYGIMILCFIAVSVLHISALWAILASALIGLIFQKLERRSEK